MTDGDATANALEVLEAHYQAFSAAKRFADATGHTVPSDTKSWSEILVSTLTGLPGRARKKGSDLDDGSDVKAANVWSAIDTPRFNGAIPAGRTSDTAQKPADLRAFDDMPYIFFALWDEMGEERVPRCRIWVVRAQEDTVFRYMCASWYDARKSGEIISTNFQLHPPRNRDDNVIRNSYGNLEYPLYFAATRKKGKYTVDLFSPDALKTGECRVAE